MKNKIDYAEIMNGEESFPRISLIIPFDGKMRSRPDLFNLLTAAADKTEKELMINFPNESVIPVMKKLRCLIKSLVPIPGEKNIGIFVSPFTEKVYYFTPSNPSKDYFPPVLVQRDSGQKRYLRNNYPN